LSCRARAVADHISSAIFIQTLPVSEQGIYGHPGGLIHAGIHALTSMVVFLLIAPSFALGAAIVIGEFVIHYHIDWMKEQTVKRRKWMFPQAEFWWVFGFDQFLHQFTYLGIVAILASARGL
jgi:hypothetical protein